MVNREEGKLVYFKITILSMHYYVLKFGNEINLLIQKPCLFSLVFSLIWMNYNLVSSLVFLSTLLSLLPTNSLSFLFIFLSYLFSLSLFISTKYCVRLFWNLDCIEESKKDGQHFLVLVLESRERNLAKAERKV